MAFKLAEAYVQFSQRGMRGVQSAVSDVSRGFSGAMKKVSSFNSSIATGGKAIAGGVVSAASMAASGLLAIGGAGVSAGSTMVTLAADAEMLETKLRVMLGSGDAAKQMLGEINEFSNATPFENMDVAGAAQQLLKFQVPAGEIFEHLKAVGDVAALTGGDLNGLATMYGKMTSGGRIMAEDLNQLIDAGVPIMGEFAKQFGLVGQKDAGVKIRQLASDGQITSDNLVQAFQNITGAGGMFENGMAQLSQTTSGKFSTMWGVIKTNAAAAGKPFLPLINRAVDFVTAFSRASRLPQVMQWVAAGVEGVIDRMSPAVKAVQDFIGPIGPLFAKAQSLATAAAGKIQQGWNSLVATAEPLWSRLSEMIGTALGAAGEQFSRLSGNVNALFQSFFGMSVVDTAATGFDALSQAAAWAADVFMTRVSQGIQIAVEVINLVIQTATSATDTFNVLWGSISGGNTIFESLTGVWGVFQSAFTAGVDQIISFTDELIDALKFLSRNFGTMWDIGLELTGIGIDNMIERIKTFGVNVGEIASWLVSNWESIFVDMANLTGSILTNIGSNLGIHRPAAVQSKSSSCPVTGEWQRLS